MNKLLISLLSLVGASAVGAGGYFLLKSNKENKQVIDSKESGTEAVDSDSSKAGKTPGSGSPVSNGQLSPKLAPQ